MSRPEPLWKSLSFVSLLLGIGAVMGGNAAAQVHGNAEFFPATICLLFVIFAQLSANAYHRYHGLLMITGIKPEIAERHLGKQPEYAKIMFYRVFAMGLALMAIIAGCTLISMGGIWFALVGVLVVVLGWGMVGSKNPLLLSSWGWFFTFLLFGPIAVLSTSMLQSVHEATDPLCWFDISPPLFMCVTIGLLAANAYLVFTYASYLKAKRVMRDTFPATFGRKATRNLFLGNSIVASGLFIYSCFAVRLDFPWIGIIPGVVCLIVNLWIWWNMKTNPRHQLMYLANWACFNVFLMGLLATIVSAFVGIPDDSHMHLF